MLEMAVIYLAAAIVAVPVAKRLGLGSVLGYLLAGILIGPALLAIVEDQTEIMHFAEFGVVMMLFLVGLELQPSRLWTLRHSILGLGGLQVVLTTLAIFAASFFVFSLPWQSAMAIGLMLALSSTAIVLQSLEERGWTQQAAGQNAFSVLLFQDIAVIPIFALLPLLVFHEVTSVSDHSGHTWVENLSLDMRVVVSVCVIGAIIVAGKTVSSPILRYIANTRLREVFTMFALFLVVAIAMIMQKIGLSPALGTFLAGVVLADSEFRHELEVNLEPFKGLLLGLFFIAVGASIDFALLIDQFLLVFSAVIGLIIIKAGVLFLLATIFGMAHKQKLLFTVALAQGGEFAFVLLTLTGSLEILTADQNKITTLVVAVSMLFSPLLFMAYEKLMDVEASEGGSADNPFDHPDEIEATKSVIIAGYGRFGQIIGRLLSAQGFHISVLDHSPSQIELLRGFGNKVFYGDAARQDLLEASGAKEAQLLVIAIDERDKTLEIVKLAQKYYPNLQIAARAVDRRHAYELIHLGVKTIKRETFDSAVTLGVDVLKLLGQDKESAERAGQLFSEHDIDSLKKLAEVWGDDKSYGIAIRQRMEDLQQVLEEDKRQNEADA